MHKSLLLSLVLAATTLVAQENPLSTSMKMMYTVGKTNLTKAAEKMPEENYGFKATDEVRSFGQIIGHVADAQYMFCAPVLGETAPSLGIEKSKTSKADLVTALKTAFEYCDKAYNSMTDAQAAAMVKFFGRDNPKLGVLSFNNMHNYEHYGNVVTYMRLKNIVPPSSEPRPQAQPKKSGD